ncbi:MULTISPECIES: ComEA family DNA-binding protein [Cupriavidus]|uniref:Competence protein ComEA helix-hairpin-helix region n=1 Tax=Cupriavidus pinatubonensis (strain JMP 134 / LMG 1197) TaxID=264198 RepID=Q46Y60_CUPPJ|nr:MULTISPECIES: helix-hairpin-helix domain-containing protein [Cupriavidus]QYY30779.1 helix-hairpin-helix domain-containing protein [Cupriavidus pinatubonensis]TPQ43289.1 competence protein ComE [Cupriavidus pinatubonensis]
MFKALFKRGCLAAAIWMALTGAAMAAVDVNTADATALTSVKGIGPATAKNIIDERTKHGPYKSAADLAERVSGVGAKSVARMQEGGLTIGAKAAPAAAAPAGAAAAQRSAKR